MKNQKPTLIANICKICERPWGNSLNGNIQVLLHMMSNIGLSLPESLKDLAANLKVANYTKNPPIPEFIYKDEMNFLMPQLIRYYVEEAKAKDKLAILKAFKIRPSEEQYKELSRLIDILYDTDRSNTDEYTGAFIQLKRNIILNNWPKEIDITSYLPIIDANLFNHNDLFTALEKALESNNVGIDKTRLYKLCHGFGVLRSIQTVDELPLAIQNKVLEVMNRDYMLEAASFLNLRHTIFSANVPIFRGIGIPREKVQDVIYQAFNDQHRRMMSTDCIFIFDNHVSLDHKGRWRRRRLCDTSNGISTSYNKYVASSYADLNGQAKLVLEFTPGKNREAFDATIALHELVFSQLSPEELRCIYEIRNGRIEMIHVNPNYKGDKLERPLAFQVGDEITQTQQNNGAYKKYFDKLHMRTVSHNVYRELGNLSSEEHMVRRRQITKYSKNYHSYATKLADCIKSDQPTLSMSVLFYRLSQALLGNDKGTISDLGSHTKLFTGVDSTGNNLLQMAIKYNNRRVFDYCLDSLSTDMIVHQNRWGNTAGHLAVDAHNPYYYDRIRFHPRFNPTIKNGYGESLEWLEECLHKGLLDLSDIQHELIHEWLSPTVVKLVKNGWATYSKLKLLNQHQLELYISYDAQTIYELGNATLSEILNLDKEKLKLFAGAEANRIYSFGACFHNIKDFDESDICLYGSISAFDLVKRYNLTLRKLVSLGEKKITLYTSNAAKALIKNYDLSLSEFEELSEEEIKLYGSEQADRLFKNFKISYDDLKRLTPEEIELYGSDQADWLFTHFKLRFEDLKKLTPDEIRLYGSYEAQTLATCFGFSLDEIKNRTPDYIKKYGSSECRKANQLFNMTLSNFESLNDAEFKLVLSENNFRIRWAVQEGWASLDEAKKWTTFKERYTYTSTPAEELYKWGFKFADIRGFSYEQLKAMCETPSSMIASLKPLQQNLLEVSPNKIRLLGRIYYDKTSGFSLNELLQMSEPCLKSVAARDALNQYMHLAPQNIAIGNLIVLQNDRGKLKDFLFSTSALGNTQLELAIICKHEQYAQCVIDIAQNHGFYDKLLQKIRQHREILATNKLQIVDKIRELSSETSWSIGAFIN